MPVAEWSPEDFPLPFRALVPDTPRIATSVDRDDGDSRFDASARFEWTPANGVAFLRLVVLREGTDSATAVGLARGLGTDFGVIGSQGMELDESVPRPMHPWAFTGYRLRGVVGSQPVTGWISMGQRQDRFFYFMALYPPEYGDGLGPRFEYILRTWRWLEPDASL